MQRKKKKIASEKGKEREELEDAEDAEDADAEGLTPVDGDVDMGN